MSGHRLYGVMLAGPVHEPEKMDERITLAGDWIRFNGLTWFVWTERSRGELVMLLNPGRVPNTQMVVVAVQPEAAAGFAPKWVWDWLNDKMQRQFMGSA